MRAALLTGPHRWAVDEIADPRPAPGELLIRTEVASICGSDVHAAAEARETGVAGSPGHEAVGTVVESRAWQYAVGDRVLCTPPAAAARCFAELQALPATQVVPLPATSRDDLVLAQQLGTAIFALKRFWPAGSGAGCSAAVLGCGPAGLAFVRLLRAAGFATIIASDRSCRRLELAAEFGADPVVVAPGEDALATALAATSGVGVDLAIEAAGRDVTRHQAMRMVRVDGRIGLFGLEERPGMSPYPLAEVFRRRPTIEMTWGAQFEDGLQSMRAAVQLLLAAPLPQLVSHRLPLERIDDAFALARDPMTGSVKVVVDFTS